MFNIFVIYNGEKKKLKNKKPKLHYCLEDVIKQTKMQFRVTEDDDVELSIPEDETVKRIIEDDEDFREVLDAVTHDSITFHVHFPTLINRADIRERLERLEFKVDAICRFITDNYNKDSERQLEDESSTQKIKPLHNGGGGIYGKQEVRTGLTRLKIHEK